MLAWGSASRMFRALLLVLLPLLAASSASAQGRELVLELTPYEPPRAVLPASRSVELMDDEALAEEELTWRLERGFGAALSVLGGIGLVGGILVAVGAADPPCVSLWGAGGCAPSQPHYDWILGGSLVAVAGAALLTTGLVLVVSGLMRRARVGDERERRRFGLSVDAHGLAIAF